MYIYNGVVKLLLVVENLEARVSGEATRRDEKMYERGSMGKIWDEFYAVLLLK